MDDPRHTREQVTLGIHTHAEFHMAAALDERGNFIGEYQAEWSLVMAASLISIVPTVALFLFFQRYFVSGIAMTGMKG